LTPRRKPTRKGKAATSAKMVARRQKVAAGLVAGKSVTQLARETKISRSHLSREVNATETRLVLQELLAAHHKKVKRLVGRTLTAIDEAFKASKILPMHDSDGEAVTLDGGADHYARLTAAKRVLELLDAAKPTGQYAPGTVTWEAFLQLRATYLERIDGPRAEA
jgi:hypothetical protein